MQTQEKHTVSLTFTNDKGDIVTTRYDHARHMWAMQVETRDGGAAHWWCAPGERTAWMISRGYMTA